MLVPCGADEEVTQSAHGDTRSIAHDEAGAGARGPDETHPC